MSETSDTPISVSEAAERLGVGAATVRRWCADGRLVALRAGGTWRILPEDLAAFLEQGTRRRLGRYREVEYAVPVHP